MSHLITFLSVGVNVLLPCNATQSVVLLQHVCLSVCLYVTLSACL